MEEVDTSKLKAVNLFINEETKQFYILDKDGLRELMVVSTSADGWVHSEFSFLKVLVK